MISRRAVLALPAAVCLNAALSACRRSETVSRGYAFIANHDGGTVAALDLDVMAVVKHIAIDGAPSQLLASDTRQVYALTSATGSIHEIQPSTLKTSRSLHVAPQADAMYLSPDESQLYVLSREERSVAAVSLDDWRVLWRLVLPEVPVDFAVSPVNGAAAFSSATTVRLVSLKERSVGSPLVQGNFGQLRFLKNGDRLFVADLDHQQVSVYRTEHPRLLTHLPIAVRPDNLCLSRDDGQLFVTSPSVDEVVILYTYDIPVVAETIVVGHAPESMTASDNLVFIASPSSGEVTVLHVGTHKVMAVVPAGGDPGAVAITPGDRFALVLNRESGDIAVLDITTLQPNRNKMAVPATKITVGSRPVSVAFHA